MENQTENREAATPAKKKKFRLTESMGYALVISFLIMLAGDLVFGAIFNLLTENITSDVGTTAKMYGSFITYWISFFLVICIFKQNRFILRQLWTKRKGNTIWMLFVGLLLGFVMNMICALAAMLNGDIHVYFESIQPLAMLGILGCVFIQSSAEELICRGYAFEKILRKHSALTAILSTSLFFAALHLMNEGITVLSFLNVFLCGVFFAELCYFTDSIWCPMAAHTAWNYTQNILLGLPNSGNVVPFSLFKLDAANARNSFAYDTGFGLEGTIVALIVYIAVIVLIWVLFHKKRPSLLRKNDPDSMPNE